MAEKTKIVVVGGGAGGLELVTKLGQRLGRREGVEITLIDAQWTHVWKPLLHEVAAGTLDAGEHQLEYLAQAKRRHFRFRLGRVDGIDRGKRLVAVAPSYDADGEQITPRRYFPYDLLVLAVGSVSNDFGVPGVAEHCMSIDTTAQAQRFQRRLLGTLLRAHAQGGAVEPGQLDVAIVGGGATGVELAAQLHHVTRQLSAYGLDEINPEKDVHLHIIEAYNRILPALPERISRAASEELAALGVDVHTEERVVEATAAGLRTDRGTWIPAGIKVWAAGIKAPDFLREIAGLETDRMGRLKVRPSLQTIRDEDIFALGDCAACPLAAGAEETVPPRAQAAHQQAAFLAKAIPRRLKARPLGRYRYHDYGSLIALSEYGTVGNLMGGLLGSVTISGAVARLAYLSLHQMHQLALNGWIRTALMSVYGLLHRTIDPHIKLH